MYEIKLPSGEIVEANDRKLAETENQATILTFTLLINSPYFNNFEEFVTKIQVFHEDEKVFEGRVINIEPSMNDSGVFGSDITCESELNYLNDARVGKWDLHSTNYTPEVTTIVSLDPYIIYENVTVASFLAILLNNHNSKVLDDKKILIGNVTVNDTIDCTTDRETTLNIIQDKLLGTKGGYLRLRKVEGINYLDYLASPPITDTNIIELAINMKSIKRQSTLNSIYTRLIPIGKDGLKINDINEGLNYIEDIELKAKYGVVETVEKFDSETDMENLKTKAIAKLQELNQNIYAIECGVLELNGINGISSDYKKFQVSQRCRLKNSILKFDEVHRIIAKTTNLDDEWDISLNFSNELALSSKNATKTEQKVKNQESLIAFLFEALFYKPSEAKVNEIAISTSKVEHGTTLNRPTSNLYIGKIYFDDTLGKQINVKTISPIVWVDAMGTTV